MAECTEHCKMFSVKVTISEKNMIHEHRRHPQSITNAGILPLQTFPVCDHTTLPQSETADDVFSKGRLA